MKMLPLSLLAIVFIALSSCSHKEETKTVEVVSPAPAQADVVAAKEREFNDLQSRLDMVRDNTHSKKFGALDNRKRTAVNEAYAKLGQARAEIAELRATADPARFNAKRVELDGTFATIRDRLDHQLAE